jgi:hypothetical protein
MAELNDAVVPEPPVDDWDQVPDQQKTRLPLLPVGTYEFQFPHNLGVKHWEKQEKEVEKEGVKSKVLIGYRVRFDADLPLTVVRDTTAEQTYKDHLFGGGISTMPRPRFVGKKGTPPKQVSDAVYVYKDALKGPVPPPFKPTEHEKLLEAICRLGAGKTFIADVAWPAFCNRKKVRRVRDSAGQLIDDPEGKYGCGKNYREAQAEEFVCECGATLFVFPELARYRASEKEGE